MIALHRERWAVQEYVSRLVRLHQLIQQGTDEEDDGEELRDEMDVYWHEMLPSELEFVGQLSEQLYDLGNDRTHPAVDLEETLAAKLTHSVDRGLWQRVLTIVRENESLVPLGIASFFRGIAYWELGLPAASAEFFKCANRLHPDEPRLQLCLLSALLVTGRLEEALPLALQWSSESKDSSLLLKAAEVIFASATEPFEPDHSLFDICIQVVRRAETVFIADPDNTSLLVNGWLILALCLSRLGDQDQATAVCKKALSYDPAKLESLAVWGYLNDRSVGHESSRLRSLSDEFRLADTRLPLPRHPYPFQISP